MDYEAILNEAVAAAKDAVAGAGEDWGACGFAWVSIGGNEPLARWARKMRKAWASKPGVTGRDLMFYGDKGYPSGWQFWNPSQYGGQRVDVKEDGARAFRDVLAKYGIRADVGSRLD